MSDQERLVQAAALKMAAKTICDSCAIGTEAVVYKGRWKHMVGGYIQHCFAWQIFALDIEGQSLLDAYVEKKQAALRERIEALAEHYYQNGRTEVRKRILAALDAPTGTSSIAACNGQTRMSLPAFLDSEIFALRERIEAFESEKRLVQAAALRWAAEAGFNAEPHGEESQRGAVYAAVLALDAEGQLLLDAYVSKNVREAVLAEAETIRDMMDSLGYIGGGAFLVRRIAAHRQAAAGKKPQASTPPFEAQGKPKVKP